MPTLSLPPACVLRRITRINNTGRHEVEDVLLREEAYDIICNNKTVARMHCMPTHLEELAVGHLFTLGMLRNACQITSLRIQPPHIPTAERTKNISQAAFDKNPPYHDATTLVDASTSAANSIAVNSIAASGVAASDIEACGIETCGAAASGIETCGAAASGIEASSAATPLAGEATVKADAKCAATAPQQGQRMAGSIRITTISSPIKDDTAKGATNEAQIRLTADEVHKLQADFEDRCTLFRQTGAAHSCALATARGILMFYEDIARHNALDKLIGAMQLQGVSPQDKLMIFSGRLAVDMLEKAVVSGVRLLMAPGAPSLASVELAEARQVSLLGFVRKDNINIYTCPHRIV